MPRSHHDAHDDEMDDGDEAPSADTETLVYCPYCGEPNEVTLDPGGGATQEYTEDCTVCCRPWWVEVTFDRHGRASVEVRKEDE